MDNDALVKIFDNIDVGIHIINEDGISVFYNSASQKTDHLTKEEVLNKLMQDLVDEGVFSESIALKTLKTGKEYEETQLVKDHLVFSKSSIIRNNNGEITYVLVTNMDLSSFDSIEKQLEDIHRLRQQLMDKVNEMSISKSSNIIGSTPEIKKVINRAIRVAKVDSSVLIQGESGTGKGLIADFIHKNSLRKDEPLISVNCAAIPSELIESELFGYEQGAFTGAKAEGKIGLLEAANGGTLFLDEIGDMPLEVQGTLLRALQDKKIRPVGSNQEIDIDIRLITASNLNLRKMVSDGAFREDLYYRINVIPIHIPPLRERREDILEMIMQFTEETNKKYDLNVSFTRPALNRMRQYQWPGNVRELQNVVERLIVTSINKDITEEEVLDDFSHTEIDNIDNDNSYEDLVERYEKELLKQLIDKYKTVRKISEVANINPSTLRKKIDRFGLKYKL